MAQTNPNLRYESTTTNHVYDEASELASHACGWTVALVNIKSTPNKLVFFALFKLLLRACQTEIVRKSLSCSVFSSVPTYNASHIPATTSTGFLERPLKCSLSVRAPAAFLLLPALRSRMSIQRSFGHKLVGCTPAVRQISWAHLQRLKPVRVRHENTRTLAERDYREGQNCSRRYCIHSSRENRLCGAERGDGSGFHPD